MLSHLWHTKYWVTLRNLIKKNDIRCLGSLSLLQCHEKDTGLSHVTRDSLKAETNRQGSLPSLNMVYKTQHSLWLQHVKHEHSSMTTRNNKWSPRNKNTMINELIIPGFPDFSQSFVCLVLSVPPSRVMCATFQYGLTSKFSTNTKPHFGVLDKHTSCARLPLYRGDRKT